MFIDSKNSWRSLSESPAISYSSLAHNLTNSALCSAAICRTVFTYSLFTRQLFKLAFQSLQISDYQLSVDHLDVAARVGFSGNMHDVLFKRSVDRLLRLDQRCQFIDARVGYGNDRFVRFDRAKWIVCRLCISQGE